MSVVTTLLTNTLAPFGPPSGQGGEDPIGAQTVLSDQFPSFTDTYEATSSGNAVTSPAE